MGPKLCNYIFLISASFSVYMRAYKDKQTHYYCPEILVHFWARFQNVGAEVRGV
jgi:hypothetical protein